MAFRLFKTEFICGTTYANSQAGILQLFTDFIDAFANDEHSNDSGWSYDTNHCPEKKPILLTPTARMYAAFLVHRTGAKLMIAHSRYGACDVDTNSTYYDTGFLGSKTYCNTNESSSGTSNRRKYIGLFSCFIPASLASNDNDFNPSVSIRDTGFYPSNSTKICCSGILEATSVQQSNFLSSANKNGVPYSCLSNSSGVVGEWFILCDSVKAAVCIGMKAKVDNPPNIYFIGDLGDGISFSDWKSQIFIPVTYFNSVSGATTFSNFYEGTVNNDKYLTAGFSDSISNTHSLSQHVQLAYSDLMSRTKAARPYFSYCVLDPNLFGYIPVSSSITNQTFNNGAWLTVSSSDYFKVEGTYSNSTTTPSKLNGVLIIAWDKSFNGSNVI